jgi:NAD-dependent SIR2 family protein deacetylase
MNFVSYVTGAMTVLLVYAMFTSYVEEEPELVGEETESSLAVNDFTGRYVTLSCQTCRKLKKHKEIEPDIYQCTKCKRYTDLRRN